MNELVMVKLFTPFRVIKGETKSLPPLNDFELSSKQLLDAGSHERTPPEVKFVNQAVDWECKPPRHRTLHPWIKPLISSDVQANIHTDVLLNVR